MRLLLWFTLFTILSVHFTEAGIYRRYVRRNRPRPLAHPHAHNRIGRRDFQVYRPSPWPSFLFRRPRSPWMYQPQPPRMARRFRFGNERVDRVPHFHHHPQSHYSGNPMTTRQQPATTLASWRPLGYGSPIDRDPTFDYAPPAVERVKFISEARNRRPTARAHTGMPPFGRPPPPPPHTGYSKRPSLWKMLAHKQRPKRPYNNMPRPPLRYHGQSPNHPLYHHQVYQDQAEIFPNIQNIVYFQPTDVVSSQRRPGPGPVRMPFHPGTPTKLVEPGNLKPGPVSDTTFPSSGEVTSESEFKPQKSPKPTPKTGRNKEYLFTVVGYKGPIATITKVPLAPGDSQKSQSVLLPSPSSTTKRTPTVLHAVKTTPVTISTTHNSAVKPFQPTESLDIFKDVSEESVEESQIVEEVVDQPKKKEPELDSLDMVPPYPIFPVIPNSFNILDSEKTEDEEDSSSAEQENEIPATVLEISSDVKPRPVFNSKNTVPETNYKTSTSVSVSVSKTDEISTQAPTVKTTTTVRSTTTTPTPKSKATSTTTSTTTEGTTTTTESTTPKPTKFPRLPTMPTYKRKPTPIYARKNKSTSSGSLGKYASSSSGSALSKEINGSGEIVVITAGRSKVKEYKPQFIADNTQLLSFDKVAETSSSSSPISVQSSPSPSSTTTKSPLQEFDPMQLLHSWFTKSQD